MIKKFVISPPFGNYISHKKATSICGSFTWEKRGNLLTRIWRFLTTVKPIMGGWVNKMGLQNPGIKSVKFKEDKVYSIAAIEPNDWDKFADYIPSNVKLEINLSCPNVNHVPITREQAKKFIDKYDFVIFKMPPTFAVYNQFEKLVEDGATHFHFSNTIPTKRGGESGVRLKYKSIDIIDEIRKMNKDVDIIGGGGISYKEDIELYEEVGATHFSLATIWFRPLIALKLLREF